MVSSGKNTPSIVLLKPFLLPSHNLFPLLVKKELKMVEFKKMSHQVGLWYSCQTETCSKKAEIRHQGCTNPLPGQLRTMPVIFFIMGHTGCV